MSNFIEYEIPDMIEIRDKKASVQSSVIKRWRVHYMTEEEVKAAQQQKDADEQREALLDEELERADQEAEELRRAQEIFERLEREAAEDAQKKLDEQRRAYAIANGELPDDMYNAATKSYSGVYGTMPMDEKTKAQLDEIMRETSNDVSALFAEAEGSAAMAQNGGPQGAEAEQALFDEIPASAGE